MYLWKITRVIEVEYLDSCGCQDVVPDGVIPGLEDEVREILWMIEFQSKVIEGDQLEGDDVRGERGDDNCLKQILMLWIMVLMIVERWK